MLLPAEGEGSGAASGKNLVIGDEFGVVLKFAKEKSLCKKAFVDSIKQGRKNWRLCHFGNCYFCL